MTKECPLPAETDQDRKWQLRQATGECKDTVKIRTKMNIVNVYNENRPVSVTPDTKR